MTQYVIDSSALIAMFKGEPGADAVRHALYDKPLMSTAVVQEFVTYLVRNGMPLDAARRLVGGLNVEVVPTDLEDAVAAGGMIAITQPHGLSHADRAILALARSADLPALTADRDWAKVADELEVTIELLR